MTEDVKMMLLVPSFMVRPQKVCRLMAGDATLYPPDGLLSVQNDASQAEQ
jgi:hypothetical protein